MSDDAYAVSIKERNAIIEECARRIEKEWPGPGAGPAASIIRDMKIEEEVTT